MKSQASLLLVSVFALSIVAVVPVAAQRPNVEDDSSSKTTTSEEERAPGQGRSQKQDRVEQVAVSTDEVREKGKKLVTEERKGKPERTKEDRQKSCEARQASIEKKLANYGRWGERHLGTFDSIYERVKDFRETKKLDAANYDELVAVADAKQLAAQESVAALKEVVTTVDCTSEDPAAAIAAVKEAVKETREALKDYRTAIKDVVRALNASASKDASGDDSESDSDDSNTTDGTTDSSAGDGTSTEGPSDTTTETGTN